MAVDITVLSKLAYFTGLPAGELETVRQYMFDKSAPRGEMIFFEGEPARNLLFIAGGVVKLFKTSAGGKEQITSLARPYDVLNEVPVFDRGPNVETAQALTAVTLYGVKEGALDTMMRQHPVLNGRVIASLAARARQLIALVEELSFKHVPERVAKILLQYGQDGQGRRLTQQEMAAMAGTAREVVARSLKSLEERGLIRLERHRIIIADKKGLEAVAEEAV